MGNKKNISPDKKEREKIIKEMKKDITNLMNKLGMNCDIRFIKLKRR